MRSPIDCSFREESEQMKTSDRTSLLVCEQEPIEQTVPDSERGLERYLSRWLRMYVAVQENLRTNGRDF